ncbi:MAG TPA: S9 family peptidase [Firmicutes bacterium]|nr:S9 family peptidase [Bacillota bacterium]
MKPIKVPDFANYKMLSSMEFSSDGKYGVVCVAQPDVESNSYFTNLWVFNPKKGAFKQLTSGNAERSFDFNSPKSVIFPSLRSESDKKKVQNGELLTVFYEISLEGGEAKELFRVPLNGATAKKIGKDLYLISALFDNARPDFASLKGDKLAAAKKAYEEEKDYEVVDELPFWFNGRGFINKKRSRLYLYNAKKNKLEPLTEPLFDTGIVKYCPKCNKVAYTGAAFTARQGQTSGLYLYDVETGETKCLVEDGSYSIGNLCFDGKHGDIVFSGSPLTDGYPAPGHSLYAVSLQGGKVETLFEQLPEDLGCTTGCDVRYGGGATMKAVDGVLYLVTSYDNTSGLCTFTRGEKELHHITKPEFGVDFLGVCDGHVYTVGLNGTQLQEVYEVNVENGEYKQLSQFNTAFFKDKYVAEPQPLSFTNKDGVRIDGFVLLPIDYDPNKKYPGILEIHGGPRTNYCAGFMHEMQVMASAGSFVFFCNPRGSSGRGEEFANIRGKYGTIEYEDIMAFTDEVLKKYPALDKDNLGVTGGSYGGFMTNWIIGHTNRFKAAASQRSISNWVSFFGVCDIGPWFGKREMGGATPWENLEGLWNASPLQYAMNAETPTLFIHSDEDYRCWLPEGIQMYSALQLKGVPTRMCIFHGENHELSRSGKPKHRIRRMNEINDWLFHYIKG